MSPKRITSALIVALLLCAFVWQGQGCASSCDKDSDCATFNNMRCGPGKVCLARCFVGETNACIAGHICDTDGTKCVPGTPTQDAASPEPTPQEVSLEPTSEASPETSPESPDTP